MALPVFRLGEFRFVNAHRPEDPAAPPLLCWEMSELVQRPGVSGTGIKLVGKKGPGFPYVTKVDFANRELAHDATRDYHNLVNVFGKQTLVHAGIDYYARYGTRYIPIEVVVLRIKRLGAAVGGLSGVAFPYWVEAQWMLQPVEDL